MRFLIFASLYVLGESPIFAFAENIYYYDAVIKDKNHHTMSIQFQIYLFSEVPQGYIQQSYKKAHRENARFLSKLKINPAVQWGNRNIISLRKCCWKKRHKRNSPHALAGCVLIAAEGFMPITVTTLVSVISLGQETPCVLVRSKLINLISTRQARESNTQIQRGFQSKCRTQKNQHQLFIIMWFVRFIQFPKKC